MFNETPSPFGLEETVARIQANVQATGNGWALSGLRNPALYRKRRQTPSIAIQAIGDMPTR